MWDPVAGIFIEYATNVSLEDVFVSFVGTPRSGKQPCSNLLFLRTFQMKFASERDDDGGVHCFFRPQNRFGECVQVDSNTSTGVVQRGGLCERGKPSSG